MLKWKMGTRGSDQEPSFFDPYPDFYSTSKTMAIPNRLKYRYRALIESNVDLIRDKTILDIASHDGRWSFAALKNGARKVIGIELRQHLVDNAVANMKRYGVGGDQYQFMVGDIDQEIRKLEPGNFDTIFCFGFLYHTMSHMFLFQNFKRLRPSYLILDTNISSEDKPVIEIREEYVTGEGYTIGDKERPYLSGWMSKSALELILKSIGYTWKYFNWNDIRANSWEGLKDYKGGARVTVVAWPAA